MNSTSGIFKDSASKVEFRLMALLGQLACEDTQKCSHVHTTWSLCKW